MLIGKAGAAKKLRSDCAQLGTVFAKPLFNYSSFFISTKNTRRTNTQFNHFSLQFAISPFCI